jgi:hypothetical protein
MKLSKLGYWFLPPVVFRLMTGMRNTLRRQHKLGISHLRTDLNELRRKRFNYFLDDRVIEEFCQYMERDDALNKPVATRQRANQKYLDELIDKGCCVVSNAFPAESIRTWHEDLKQIMDAASKRCDELVNTHGRASMRNISESYLGNRINFELVSGVIRLWDVHLIRPQLRSVLQNECLMDVVGSFFGGNPNQPSIYLEYKNKVDWYEPNTDYHSDSPFRILKAWLLLNDVGPRNAPFVYCERSQYLGDWRILRDLLEFSKYNKKHKAFYAHFSRTELAHLGSEFPDLCAPAKQIAGKAGDIIIADTRGVHGGTTLHEGYRLQLGLVFSGLGNAFIGNIPDEIKNLSRDSH